MKKGKIRLLPSYRKAESNEEIVWLIGESILVLLFALAIFSWLSDLEKNTYIEKQYLSHDLALLIDSMYAAPGNIQFEYQTSSANISKYNFVFASQIVSVINPEDEYSTVYWFADDKKAGSIISAEARQPEKLILCNSAGIVTIGTESCTGQLALECPEIDTALPSGQRPVVMLNPVFGGQEEGKKSEDGTAVEKELARVIAKSVRDWDSSSQKFIFKETRSLSNDLLPPNDILTIEQRQQMMEQESYDLWVTVSIGESSPGRQPIRTKMPEFDSSFSELEAKNEKLGCTITNKITGTDLEVTDASPVVKDGIDVLLKPRQDAMAIEITVGNINSPQGSLLYNTEQTGKLVYEALLLYYGLEGN